MKPTKHSVADSVTGDVHQLEIQRPPLDWVTPGRAAAGAGVIAAVIYLMTMNRTIGFMDSGEVAAAASTLGIMHPTGYPTLTILGYLITAISPLRDILTLNIFAALLSAAGIGVLTLLFDYLLGSFGGMKLRTAAPDSKRTPAKKKQEKRPKNDPAEIEKGASVGSTGARAVVAGLAALFVGFSAIWWAQATDFEVYALQSLLLPLVTLLFVRFVDLERERRVSGDKPRGFAREGTMFALVLGLAFTNHMMTIFLAPAFLIYYFWSLGINVRSLRRILFLIPPFVAGLLPYLYLPIRASMGPRFNWGNTTTWDRFFEHVSGQFVREWMFSGADIYKAQTMYFFDRLPGELAYIGVVIAVAGLIFLMIRDARLGIWSLLIFAACAAYAGGYRIYDIELYYTTAILAAGIWILAGLRWLMQRTGPVVAIAAAALIAVVNLALHYAPSDHSGNYLAEDVVWNTLMTAPQKSLIFSSNAAMFVTGSYYLQAVEKVRPDVTVINHDYLSFPWYLDELSTWQPELMAAVSKQVESYRVAEQAEKGQHGDPSAYLAMSAAYDEMIQAMVAWGMKQGNVLVAGEVERAFGSDYVAVPWDFGYRLMRDTLYVPQPFPSYRFRRWDHVDAFTASVYETYGRRLLYRASYEAEHGNDSLAARYRQYALTFDPQIRPEDVEELPLDAVTQVRATAEFYARLRQSMEQRP
jgi:hypothetical protein